MAVVMTVILISAFVFFALNAANIFAHDGSDEAAETDGADYIFLEEAVDPLPIEARIFEEDHRRSYEELIAEFESDPASIWRTLKEYNTLIMGDSRAECFLVYGFMDDAHCLVEHSTTIYKISELLGDVAARSPRVIVISYGINDVGLYHDFGVEKYMSDFEGLIGDLRAAAPGAYIFVNSIIPSLESEYDRAPNWMAIPEWNAYIQAYCESHDIGYIDVTPVAAAHRDMYIDDGVHLAEEFYPYWGSAIAARIVSEVDINK